MSLDFFFSQARPLALILNAVTSACVLVAVGQLIHAWINRLQPDVQALKRLRAEASLDRDRCVSLVAHLGSASLLRNRIQLLQELKQRQHHVDSDALAAIATEQLREDTAFPRIIASLVVLIGLAGTLAGLGGAVETLVATLGQGGASIQLMKEGILGTLGSMSTAFSTTLAGVIGTFIVQLAVRYLTAAQSRFLRDLESFNVSVLIPLFDTSESSVLDIAAHRLETLTASFEQRLTDLVGELEQRGNTLELVVRRGFDEMMERLAERTGKLIAEMEAVRDRMVRLIGDSDAAGGSLADHLARIGAASKELAGGIAGVGRLIPELRTSVESILRDQQAALVAVVRAQATELLAGIENQRGATEGLVAAVGTLSEGSRGMREDVSGLAAAADQFRSVWSEIGGSVQRIEGEIAGRLEALAAALREHIDRVAADQASAHQTVLSALRGYEASLDKTLRTLEEEPHRYGRQAEELLEALRDILNRQLPSIGQAVSAAQKETNARIEQALLELAREFRVLAGQHEDHGFRVGPRPRDLVVDGTGSAGPKIPANALDGSEPTTTADQDAPGSSHSGAAGRSLRDFYGDGSERE